MYRYYELYEIADKIIKYYKELIKSLQSGKCESQIYNVIIQKIKQLIIDEYNLVNEIPKVSIDEILSIIKQTSDEDKKEVNSRIRTRLIHRQDILDGKYFKGSDFHSSNLPKNIKFSIYEVLSAMLKIAAMKKTKYKIDHLKLDNNQDRHFVDALRVNLKIFIISISTSFTASELIILDSELDIDRMPDIDNQLIADKINSIYKGIDEETGLNAYDQLLYSLTIHGISLLSKIHSIANNPSDICDYLYRLTELETMVSYMTQKGLIKLKEYCMRTKYNNPTIEENIKRLIKEKLESN